MKKQKSFVILDLDDTQFAALVRFKHCLSKLMQDFASAHGIEYGHVTNLVREADGQHRFNDGAALVDAMVQSDPALRSDDVTLSAQWKLADEKIQKEWIDHSQRQTQFFPGVLATLQKWSELGVRTVIQTDCEDVAAIRNLWMLGVNAHENGELKSPFEILDLYETIYCQPGIEMSPHFAESIDPTFFMLAEQKLKRWDDRHYKPHRAHIERILADAGVSADEAIYVGDSHKDGAEASSHTPPVDFVWAKYGINIGQDVLQLCKSVASRSFSYGNEAISAEMQERKIQPDLTLEGGFQDVFTHYQWKYE